MVLCPPLSGSPKDRNPTALACPLALSPWGSLLSQERGSALTTTLQDLRHRTKDPSLIRPPPKDLRVPNKTKRSDRRECQAAKQQSGIESNILHRCMFMHVQSISATK